MAGPSFDFRPIATDPSSDSRLVSMRVNSESISNEIDESELQNEKHSEQRI
jgi:hypothetical protein